MVSRNQQFLDAIAAGDPTLLPTPITREERFLHALSTGAEITPTTYEEQFMQAARAFKGGGEESPTTPSVSGLPFIFVYNYYMVSSKIGYQINGEYRLYSLPIVPGASYLVKRSEAGSQDEFSTGFTATTPVFDNVASYVPLNFVVRNYALEATLIAPPGSTHLIVFERSRTAGTITFSKL